MASTGCQLTSRFGAEPIVYARVAIAMAAILVWEQSAAARNWTDSTGRYSIEANLVAFSHDSVVLKNNENKLLSVPIDRLSEADRTYLESQEAKDADQRLSQDKQTWQMAGGATVVGRVVDYAERTVVVQARRGRIYANDRLFDNLPEIYKQILMRGISRYLNVEINDKDDLKRWAARLKGQPREFHAQGVLLELEDGDVYMVPFILFSEQDRQLLEAGWSSWHAANQGAEDRHRQSLAVQALAAEYQRNREATEQVRQLHLQLLATAAGVTNLWEVLMTPAAGAAGPPIAVVVPGRDSRQASLAAQQQYPGYVVGPVRRVN